MRYAVISDVHANLEAVQAVLKDIKKSGIGEILFLGDAAGYGPDPVECLNTLHAECKILIAGNHDMAVLGLTGIEFFSYYACKSIEWSLERISAGNIKFLEIFKTSEIISEKDIFLVHSSPKEPQKWSYLQTLLDAADNFNYFDAKMCFLGHSHKPFIIEKKPSGEMCMHRDEVRLSDASRYIINAGSVGQPRDGDPRSCYCVFDEGLIYFRRVEYDIKKTQDKMMKYGLPFYLADRLSHGL